MSGRVDDLIGRLRNRTHDSPMHAEHMMDEAADEIERLRARVAELEATVNEMAGV